MKRWLLPIILGGAFLSARAGESTEKVQFKFGGRIDAVASFDSYESKVKNTGIFYFYPWAPNLNAYGEDLNAERSLRFGVASTRLNGTVLVPELLGAKGKAFVEVDFMGTSDNTFGVLRLRHAYFNLDWKNGQLLIGQTDNLSVPAEIAPNTVSFGAGAPINPLSRMVQVRYTHHLGSQFRLAAALGMFGGSQGEMQSDANTPDMQLRLTWGAPEATFVGIGGGFRSMRPRKTTDDEHKTQKRVTVLSASAFGQHTFCGGHKLRLFGMWGEDLSALTMLGGFAPKLSDVNGLVEDYSYAPVRSVATWLDFETAVMKGWQPGFFAGWTKNLGTAEEVDLSLASITDYGIDWYLRISPRIYYHYKKLSFGLEYMYSLASWGEEFSAKYRPTRRYENSDNHRVTLLARFKF